LTAGLSIDRVLQTAAEALGALHALRPEGLSKPFVTLSDTPDRAICHGNRRKDYRSNPLLSSPHTDTMLSRDQSGTGLSATSTTTGGDPGLAVSSRSHGK
jgi:hypothetical protein